tara:strand:+ start:335 stop:1012 length:678 start_codon:yes stop_codon:yes gene_type:complete
MGFNMKGSPAKLGTIQGTAGHASALKMAAEAEAAKNSPVPIVGAIAKAAGKVGKVAGKVTGAINKVKGAFNKGKEEGSATPYASPAKTNVPTKEEAKKEGIKKIDKSVDALDDAFDRGDVLTENIHRKNIKNIVEDGKKRGFVNKSATPYASPAKHTKEAAGFEHPHPHTEKEEETAQEFKKRKTGYYIPKAPKSKNRDKISREGFAGLEQYKRGDHPAQIAADE